MSRILVIARDNPLSLEIGNALGKWNFPMEYATGGADTLHLLRMKSFEVVVTSSESSVDEDLALLEEMRAIRPGVKTIVLAPASVPAELISALRAKVFACFTRPLRPGGFGLLLATGTVDELIYNEIGNEVLLIKYVAPRADPS